MGDETFLNVWVPCIWPIRGTVKSQSSYNRLLSLLTGRRFAGGRSGDDEGLLRG